MIQFLKVNVNPKKRKTGDCAVRAVCQACNIPYEQAAKELFDEWMRTGYDMTSPRVFAQVLANHGFVKHGKPKKPDGKTYSVGDLIEEIGEDSILVIQVASHWTVSKACRIIDLWCPVNKSVYGYFAKKAAPREMLAYDNGKPVRILL